MDTAIGMTGLVLLGCVLCAMVAVLSPRLIAAALWLAGTSACLALSLYLLDAQYAAVIELSVGAGLVAVLFVLALTTVGDQGVRARANVPRWLAAALVVLCIGVFGWMLQPNLEVSSTRSLEPLSFAQAFWQERALDVIGQLGLLFVAALGVRVLLGPVAATPAESSREGSLEAPGTEPARDIAQARRQHEVQV